MCTSFYIPGIGVGCAARPIEKLRSPLSPHRRVSVEGHRALTGESRLKLRLGDFKYLIESISDVRRMIVLVREENSARESSREALGSINSLRAGDSMLDDGLM